MFDAQPSSVNVFFMFRDGCIQIERESGGWILKPSYMRTQGVHLIGVLPWLVRWARCAGARDFCPALSSTKYFFSHWPLFHCRFVPISQQAGQAVVPRHLSLGKCLWMNIDAKCVHILQLDSQRGLTHFSKL